MPVIELKEWRVGKLIILMSEGEGRPSAATFSGTAAIGSMLAKPQASILCSRIEENRKAIAESEEEYNFTETKITLHYNCGCQMTLYRSGDSVVVLIKIDPGGVIIDKWKSELLSIFYTDDGFEFLALQSIVSCSSVKNTREAVNCRGGELGFVILIQWQNIRFGASKDEFKQNWQSTSEPSFSVGIGSLNNLGAWDRRIGFFSAYDPVVFIVIGTHSLKLQLCSSQFDWWIIMVAGVLVDQLFSVERYGATVKVTSLLKESPSTGCNESADESTDDSESSQNERLMEFLHLSTESNEAFRAAKVLTFMFDHLSLGLLQSHLTETSGFADLSLSPIVIDIVLRKVVNDFLALLGLREINLAYF